MSAYLLTPAAATAHTAEVCAMRIASGASPSPPGEAWLEERDTGRRTALADWSAWRLPDGRTGVWRCRTRIDALAPRSARHLDMMVAGKPVASALVTTLPERLPTIEERPLTVMLGSCFCVDEDRSGRAGRRFASLPGALRPDIKLLTGDQVYLDAPFYRFLWRHSSQGLAESFLLRYRDTWAQTGDRQGFRQVLASGPAYFTADDHELWNNAPYPSFAMDTWTAGGRATWLEHARGLYAAFQTAGGDPVQQVDIGDLSLFIADTRITRSDDRSTFIAPAAMQALRDWAANLSAPGVLVVGQPVFAAQAGWLGRIADWNLPDFDQYGELCEALLTAPQSIVILTGDVHYGRVAQLRTPAGHELIEIIASPMSLVSVGGAREWKPAPDLFPASPIPGLAQTPVSSLESWQRAADHFLTLELWGEGARLQMRVRTWETAPDAGTPDDPVFEYALTRRT